jgi:PIN domain nuclease of toxin-antitoxin system
MILVLDTCALLWLTLAPKSLSARAPKAIAEADKLVVCSVSIWEIGIKWKNGRIDLGISFEDYVARVGRCKDFEMIPVDAGLWARSVLLPWEHRDPADRLIVALASDLNATIVTADGAMKKHFEKCIA